MVKKLPDPDSVLILDDAESEEISNVEVFEVEDDKQSIFDDNRHSSLCDEYLDEILDVLQPQTESSPYEQVTSPRCESIDDVVESIAAIKASFRLYGKRAKEKRETLTAAITWRIESHGYQHMLCPFKVPPNKRGERKVVPGGCPLIIPQNADIVNDDVKIKVHTVGPDERHPRVFAVDAEEQDIGKRIAFELFWTNLQGGTVTYWPTGRNRRNVYRANSFADKLLLQLLLTDIRHKERRYVKWSRGKAPRGYEDCEGGLYTSPVV